MRHEDYSDERRHERRQKHYDDRYDDDGDFYHRHSQRKQQYYDRYYHHPASPDHRDYHHSASPDYRNYHHPAHPNDRYPHHPTSPNDYPRNHQRRGIMQHPKYPMYDHHNSKSNAFGMYSENEHDANYYHRAQIHHSPRRNQYRLPSPNSEDAELDMNLVKNQLEYWKMMEEKMQRKQRRLSRKSTNNKNSKVDDDDDIIIDQGSNIGSNASAPSPQLNRKKKRKLQADANEEAATSERLNKRRRISTESRLNEFTFYPQESASTLQSSSGQNATPTNTSKVLYIH